MTPLRRAAIIAVVLSVGESVWAYYSGVAGVDLLVFYGVLVAASLVLFIPGLIEAKGQEAPAKTKG